MQTFYTNVRRMFLILLCLQASIRSDASNYYWVGGSGNWSDLTHWATSSGGTALPAVVPGITDDVFFDANSGFTGSSKTVTVNVSANCRNISVAGSSVPPIFNNTGGTISIYGNSLWQSGMQFNVSATFKSSTSVTITTNGVKFGLDLNFNGSGTWTLQDSLSVINGIYITQGTLNTNNYAISTLTLVSNGGSAKTLNLGNSTLHIMASGGTCWDFSGSGSVLNAGTSTIIMEQGGALFNNFLSVAGHSYYKVIFRKSANLTGGSAGSPVFFKKCIFMMDANLNSHSTFDSLLFNAGSTYKLQFGCTQKVNKYFSSYAATCDNYITIITNLAGSQATINAPATCTVVINRNVIQDIVATGGATFNAGNSFSGGNNSGISFSSPGSSQTLYWVGGSGRYDDISHWSASSGGTGGYCVPGPLDNVFFDANSGLSSGSQTITVSSMVYCHNITCSGSATAPIFTSATGAMNIFGSSIWQNGMSYAVITNYKSGSPETITSNSVKFSSQVNYTGTGSWTLQDSAAFSQIILYSGTFNTNNYPISLNIMGSSTTFTKNLNLGSSTVHVVIGTVNAWTFLSSGVNLNAGTSTILFEKGAASLTTMTSLPGHAYYNVKFLVPGTLAGGIAGTTVFYKKCTFVYNGTLNGFSTFDSLLFSAGNLYVLQSGNTQKVNNYFSSYSPTCASYIAVNSSTTGTQATLNIPSTATVIIQKNVIQDINGTGGGSFVANSSTNLGNNSGFTFVSGSSLNLYWVGGSGVYDDISHWAASSGGAGGYCVPGPSDNVFFDVNSGLTGASKTITVSSNVYCRNITCSGSATPPVFTTGGGVLNIFGSSVWQAGMTYNVTTIFRASFAATLTSNQVRFDQAVTFNGTGSWTLLDSASFALNNSNCFTLTQGTFNTNNYPLNLAYLISNGTASKTMNLGSSTIHLNSTSTTSWLYVGTGSNIIAGTSTIIFETGPSTSSMGSAPGLSYNRVIARKSVTVSGGTAGSPVNFKNFSFLTNGGMNGYSNFDTLLLRFGSTYTLQSGSTQKVNSFLDANGNPCFILYLVSSLAGSQANLCVVSGPTAFNFANVKDINASCQALSFSDKSTNSGNNTNITFAPYNSGVLAPLGPDTDYPCSQYPYPLSASGFFPSITTTFAWSNGVSALVSNAAAPGKYWVRVTYSPGCVVADTVVIGYANPLPVLIPAGKALVSKLYCDYGGKKYFMGNAATSSKDKAVLCLIPNGNTISPDSVIVDNSGNMTSSAGGGTFSNSGSGYYQSTDGSNTFRISKRMYTVVAPGSYTNGAGVGVRIYYTAADTMAMVSDAFPGGIPLTSEGWYKCKTNSPQATLDSLTPKDLLSAVQIYPTARGVEAGVKYVEFYVNNFSTFGYFTSTVVSPLPVKLVNFKGEIKNCKVELSWSATMETNFSHYEVEMSNDALHWYSSGQVRASRIEGIHQYIFNCPQGADKAYYRLKMLDMDGTFTYSPSILVENTCASQKAGIEVYPNPFDEQDEYLTLSFKNVFGRHLRLNLVDASGRVVLEEIVDVTQSDTLLTVSTSGIQTGIYFLRLYGQDNKDILVPIKLIKF